MKVKITDKDEEGKRRTTEIRAQLPTESVAKGRSHLTLQLLDRDPLKYTNHGETFQTDRQTDGHRRKLLSNSARIDKYVEVAK